MWTCGALVLRGVLTIGMLVFSFVVEKGIDIAVFSLFYSRCILDC